MGIKPTPREFSLPRSGTPLLLLNSLVLPITHGAIVKHMRNPKPLIKNLVGRNETGFFKKKVLKFLTVEVPTD